MACLHHDPDKVDMVHVGSNKTNPNTHQSHDFFVTLICKCMLQKTLNVWCFYQNTPKLPQKRTVGT